MCNKEIGGISSEYTKIIYRLDKAGKAYDKQAIYTYSNI